MGLIGNILLLCVDIYMWIIIISVVISWLLAFGVINTRNPQAENIVRLLNRATEPVYRPLRKVIPPISGIDLTPMIVIFGLMILKQVIASVFFY